MKINLKIIDKFIKTCIVAMSLLCGNVLMAGNATDKNVVHFEEAIRTPEVPNKAAKCIKSHISKINDWLLRHGLQASLIRNDEGILVNIPCGEIFAPNTSDLNTIGKEKLDLLRDVLKYSTMYKIVVAVHSDETGSQTYYQTLTDSRAQAVCSYFKTINKGQDLNVEKFGIGSRKPLNVNDSMEGRSKNRRVEIYILPEWQMIDAAKSGRLCK